MRVLHVDTATEWRGGQVQLWHLAKGMRDRGHDVVVGCVRDGPLWTRLKSAGLPVLAVPAGRSTRAALAIRSFDGDVVAAHSSHAHTVSLAARVPLVVHRRVDFVPTAGWKYRRPALFIAVSAAVAAILRSVGVTKTVVVHDGVDALPPAEPASDGPDVLAVGARVAHKGHVHLAEAARELPGVDIGVAGDGPLLYPGLRWLGARSDVAALLARAKVFVHPSVEEGMGQVLVEAMLSRIPLVTTNAGGIPEVVGDTGIIVPRGDAHALALAIRRALAGDHPSVEAAYTRAVERFSVAAMVEGTIAAYRTVLPSGLS